MKKIMYIMRGIPGSGKSFTAKFLAEPENIYSTDDFWGEDYNFDPQALRFAHKWNQNRVLKALQQDISPIVVDNTNVTRKDVKIYVDLAKKFDYVVIYKEPESEWWREIKPIIEGYNDTLKEQASWTLFHKNQHNVPQSAILRMILKWVPTKQLNL